MDKKRDLDKFVDFMRNALTSGPVCDGMFKCNDMTKFKAYGKYFAKSWQFCPWCGKRINNETS